MERREQLAGNDMIMRSYTDLVVWQKAMDLVDEVYRLVSKLPKIEAYALSDQMRRAVVSIPSNIAEGQARAADKQFLFFLSVARGSNAEIETQLMICVRQNYLKESEIEKAMKLCDEVGKMLTSLMKSISGSRY